MYVMTLANGREVPVLPADEDPVLKLTVFGSNWHDVAKPLSKVSVRCGAKDLGWFQIDVAEQDDAPHGPVCVTLGRLS